jgi:hypothetical protein
MARCARPGSPAGRAGKVDADQELVAAIRAVAAGERPLRAQVGQLAGRADEVLTRREREP